MAGIMNCLRQTIGVLYKSQEWGDKTYASIMKEYYRAVDKYTYDTIYLTSGDIISFIPVDTEERGYRIDKAIIEPCIDTQEIDMKVSCKITNQVFPIYKYDTEENRIISYFKRKLVTKLK